MTKHEEDCINEKISKLETAVERIAKYLNMHMGMGPADVFLQPYSFEDKFDALEEKINSVRELHYVSPESEVLINPLTGKFKYKDLGYPTSS